MNPTTDVGKRTPSADFNDQKRVKAAAECF